MSETHGWILVVQRAPSVTDSLQLVMGVCDTPQSQSPLIFVNGHVQCLVLFATSKGKRKEIVI
jgi:hypothetical protein